MFISLMALLAKTNTDLILLAAGERASSNITYLTGAQLTHAGVCITKAGARLYVSPLDYGKKSKIPITVQKKPLLDTLKKYHSKRIGLEFNATSIVQIKNLKKAFPRAKFIDIGPTLEKIRAIKTTDELELMAKAAQIANQSYKKIIDHFDYRTESDIKAALEYEMAKRGASPAFPTIVASGSNASIPHHATSSAKLNNGLCIIDFGANYHGYCSDCTRTVSIGTPTRIQKKLYATVLNAQLSAITQVTPEKNCADIDKTARTALGKLNKYFIHSLGHGIGIDVHETPNISAKSKDILKENSVITIEPGIYIPRKLGIRIEDTLVVGNKPNILTNLAKELFVVK